jgi:rhodanese-related sulfurtransferase
MPAWEEKGYALYFGPDYGKRVKTTIMPAKEFKALMGIKPGSFVLVDVREPDEFTEGHIPGAINIPVTNFTAAARLDRNRKIIIYCNTGARSYSAYRKLNKQAFPDIGQVTFEDWKEAGFLIEK